MAEEVGGVSVNLIFFKQNEMLNLRKPSWEKSLMNFGVISRMKQPLKVGNQVNQISVPQLNNFMRGNKENVNFTNSSKIPKKQLSGIIFWF